jgi:hypothetical protein
MIKTHVNTFGTHHPKRHIKEIKIIYIHLKKGFRVHRRAQMPQKWEPSRVTRAYALKKYNT